MLLYYLFLISPLEGSDDMSFYSHPNEMCLTSLSEIPLLISFYMLHEATQHDFSVCLGPNV